MYVISNAVAPKRIQNPPPSTQKAAQTPVFPESARLSSAYDPLASPMQVRSRKFEPISGRAYAFAALAPAMRPQLRVPCRQVPEPG